MPRTKIAAKAIPAESTFSLDKRLTGLKTGYNGPDIQFGVEKPLMISRTADYALRAVVALGSNPEGPRTTQQIAQQTRVPLGYLSKVLQALSRAGLVMSQRGLNGGFVLSRPLEQLTILDVINAVDPLKRIERCPLGLDDHGDRLCPLHQRLDQGIAQLEALFGTTTIDQLLAEQKSKQPLCSWTVHGISPERSRGECHTPRKPSSPSGCSSLGKAN